jgi:hypothetical protein
MSTIQVIAVCAFRDILFEGALEMGLRMDRRSNAKGCFAAEPAIGTI